MLNKKWWCNFFCTLLIITVWKSVSISKKSFCKEELLFNSVELAEVLVKPLLSWDPVIVNRPKSTIFWMNVQGMCWFVCAIYLKKYFLHCSTLSSHSTSNMVHFTPITKSGTIFKVWLIWLVQLIWRVAPSWSSWLSIFVKGSNITFKQN